MSHLRRALVASLTVATSLAGLLTISAPAQASLWCDRSMTIAAGQLPAGPGEQQLTCQMSIGANSDAVRALQTTLNKCYSQELDVDGDFGPKTRRALVAAQRRAGAVPDGIYGPETMSKLSWPSFLGCRRLDEWARVKQPEEHGPSEDGGASDDGPGESHRPPERLVEPPADENVQPPDRLVEPPADENVQPPEHSDEPPAVLVTARLRPAAGQFWISE